MLLRIFLLACAFAACEDARARCIVIPTDISREIQASLKDTGCDSAELSVTDLVTKFGHESCIESGEKRVVCSAPLRADNLHDVNIEGSGWKIVFSDPRPGKGGLFFNKGRNIVLRSVEIGWLGGGASDRPLDLEKRIVSKGVVLSCDGDKGGMLSLEESGNGTVPVAAISVWDDVFGWPWRPQPDRKAVERYFPKSTTMLFENGRGLCGKELKSFVGQRVLVRHHVYSAHAFECRDCERIAIENVTIRSAPGMGFVFTGGAGGILLRKNLIAPSCSPNCLRAEPSLAADGAHLAAIGGGVLIENNDFGWQGDDSLNITGLLISGRVETPRDLQWFKVDDRSRNRFWLFREGGKVSLFDAGLQELGTAKVLEIDRQRFRMRLSTLPQGSDELLATPSDRVPTHVVVRNNYFHDHRARAVLMGASNAVVEGNTIARVTMAAILVAADTASWLEGPGARGVHISRNRISKVNAQAAQGDYSSAISVAFRPPENYKGAVGTPIRDIVVDNNSFSDIFSNASVPVMLGRGVAQRIGPGR